MVKMNKNPENGSFSKSGMQESSRQTLKRQRDPLLLFTELLLVSPLYEILL